MKLWAFGCSNTYGFSLGTALDSKQFLKKHKINLKEKWTAEVKKVQKSASIYSWPNQLAKQLDIEIENLAEPGSGLDKCILNLNKVSDSIDWQKDIVCIGVPKIYRYTGFDGKNLVLSCNIFPGAPSTESLDVYFDSMLLYIESKYPKVHLVKIYDNDMQSIGIDASSSKHIDYINQKGLASFDSGRYPCGHFNEATHKKFADYLYTLIHK